MKSATGRLCPSKNGKIPAMRFVDSYGPTRNAIEQVGGSFDIHGAPNELKDFIPFEQDFDLGEMTVHRALPARIRHMVRSFIVYDQYGACDIRVESGH